MIGSDSPHGEIDGFLRHHLKPTSTLARVDAVSGADRDVATVTGCVLSICDGAVPQSPAARQVNPRSTAGATRSKGDADE
jgi:hypothetical protein